MPLISSKNMLEEARAGNYGVGAFNTNNLESTQAIISVAGELGSPVMIQTSQSAIQYAGGAALHAMVKTLADGVDVPVALHLDHGTDLDVIRKCIDWGWTSIMIDASSKPFDENVSTTRRVVEMAHAAGIPVEAEIGQLGGIEDEVEVSEEHAHLTDVAEAERFVKETECDSLAVAVGTSHGAYKFKGSGDLALDRLREIADRIAIPLVLHGASGVPEGILERALRFGAKLPGAKGVPESEIQKAVKLGISKINIDTDLRLAFTGAVREVIATQPEVFDPRKILGPSREAIEDVVRRKIRLFGSEGKA
ncbi:MAG: class II fructose-1,6-bisphosphate aldolase [Candidatus Eisenbacteria sp.]|nr:class II fructose-1,6-bisphosphate aldolase [Candidatus Eisenbacteria bacterium]